MHPAGALVCGALKPTLGLPLSPEAEWAPAAASMTRHRYFSFASPARAGEHPPPSTAAVRSRDAGGDCGCRRGRPGLCVGSAPIGFRLPPARARRGRRLRRHGFPADTKSKRPAARTGRGRRRAGPRAIARLCAAGAGWPRTRRHRLARGLCRGLPRRAGAGAARGLGRRGPRAARPAGGALRVRLPWPARLCAAAGPDRAARRPLHRCRRRAFPRAAAAFSRCWHANGAGA